MKVDLSKAKAGDTVKFRCGGKQELFNDPIFLANIDKNGVYKVDFCDREFMYFFKDGNISDNTHPFDIIEIISAPFNLADVKQGMAFKFLDGKVYFLSHDWEKNSPYVLVCNEHCENVFKIYKTAISDKRSPEHDLEVE